MFKLPREHVNPVGRQDYLHAPVAMVEQRGEIVLTALVPGLAVEVAPRQDSLFA